MDMDNKEKVIAYITEHKEALYRLAYTYTKNEQDALDVVQEATYKALVSAHTLKDCTLIKTWVYRIVVNTALDLIRRTKKVILATDEMLESDDGRYDQYENIDLKRALEKLEIQDKAIIVLRYFEDMKLQDIATVLGINQNTLKTKLYKVLRKLKIDME